MNDKRNKTNIMRALQYVIILITVMISVVLHGQVAINEYGSLNYPYYNLFTERIENPCDIAFVEDTFHSTMRELNEKITSDSSYIVNISNILRAERDALVVLEISSGIEFETGDFCCNINCDSNKSNYRAMYQWYLAHKDSVDICEVAKYMRDLDIVDYLEMDLSNTTDSMEKKLITDSIELIRSRHPQM